MKIKFLGTAAAEGIPSLYCQCETCLEALSKKGRNIRTRCQSLIDDALLLDFGPDTYFHMITQEVRLDKIHHVLITHKHSDHFYKSDILFRRPGYACVVEKEPLYFYGTKKVYDIVNDLVEEEKMADYVQAKMIAPYEAFKVMDYEIIPVRANHSIHSDPVNYIISKDGKTLFYAHDTGYFEPKTWETLEKLGKPLDLITLDCTACILTGWVDYHLSFDTFLKVVDEMKKRNIVDDKTIIVANHFSHNGKANYDKMVEVASKENVIVAYDGMEIEF
jgi:phosphoribosyl 1,2-cyclic phosphate phosphodiesterase